MKIKLNNILNRDLDVEKKKNTNKELARVSTRVKHDGFYYKTV